MKRPPAKAAAASAAPAARASSPPPATFLDWLEAQPGWLYALIFLATLLAYTPALAGAVLWDDAGHLTRPDLQSLAGLGRIWFEPGATQQYYPLLHSAFWFEHLLWGDATTGYHLVNVLLHATGACLVFVVLRRLAIRGAALAALLFALHPVCVESVAWIAEQKNTLSLVLYLCAALVYFRFSESRRPGQYVGATLLFLAALCTKTVTATLPAALLVILWWRNGRIDRKRDVEPLLLWFAFSAAAAVVTSWFERTQIGAQGASFDFTPLQRALLAGRVVWFYFGKLILPVNLSFVYPRWTLGPADLAGIFGVIAALALAFLLWRYRQRGALAALLFFAGTLFPALGFINVYPFVFSFVADHFQYLASLGVITALAAGATIRLVAWPRAFQAGAALVLLVLTVITWNQSYIYRDSISLFEDTLRKNPDSPMAHNNLAEALAREGRVADAVPHLERALQLQPAFAEAENNLGDDLRALGRFAEAVPHFEAALRLQPTYAVAHNNLGIVFMSTNRPDEGIAQFKEALRLNPKYAQAHFNLGLALATTNHTAEAITHFQEALRIAPSYADAELNWAIGLTITNRFAEAVPHFEHALQLDPDSVNLHASYARALGVAGKYDEAISQYRRALELDPNSGPAHLGLGLLLRQTGRPDEANAELAQAQRLGVSGPP